MKPKIKRKKVNDNKILLSRYENYLKFYEGIGYDTSKNREVQNSNYIFSQPGRKAAIEVSHALVNHETGYATSNAEIASATVSPAV